MEHEEQMHDTVAVVRGVPTEPAVKRLIEAHGDLKPDDVIDYTTMCEAFMVEDRADQRFQTCVNAWRKTLWAKHNIVVKAVANVGYRVLAADDRITEASRWNKTGIKRIVRAARCARETAIDEITTKANKEQRLHLMHAGAAFLLAEKTTARVNELEG